nr:hypothetical protein [Mesorhizobium sp. CA14]
MEKPGAPWPLLQFAIEPKSRADEQEFRTAFLKVTEEQPDFQVKWDEESGQTIIGAMREVDLETIIDRLRHEFNVSVNVGAPQVAYRETITRTHEQDYTHKRQFAGQGQFARVTIMFEPNGQNVEFMFLSGISDNAVPDDYVMRLKRGCEASSPPVPMLASR